MCGSCRSCARDHRPPLSYRLLPRLWRPRHGRATARCAAGRLRPAHRRGRHHPARRLPPQSIGRCHGCCTISLGLPHQPGERGHAPAARQRGLGAGLCRQSTPPSRQHDRCNIDETSWKEAGKRRWLWTMVTAIATCFYVATSRNGPGLRHLLGASAYRGIVGSDRHRPYLALPAERHQLCWSHLIRNFQALVDRGGRLGSLGRGLLGAEPPGVSAVAPVPRRDDRPGDAPSGDGADPSGGARAPARRGRGAVMRPRGCVRSCCA